MNIGGLGLTDYGCIDPYSYGSNRDSTAYGPEYMHNQSLADFLDVDDESEDAWKYSSAGKAGDFPFMGEISSYKGDGFSTELIIDRETTAQTLQELKENLWIDRQTRALFLEFILYNADSNLFAFVKLWAEIPITGGFLSDGDVTMIRVYATGFNGIYMRVMEVLFLALLIANIGLSFYQLANEDNLKVCIRRPRIIVDIFLFILCLFPVLFFILRYLTTTDLITQIKGKMIHFIPFQRAIFFHEFFFYVLAFVVAFAMFKFIILLRLMERIAKLAASLKNSGCKLIPIICSFILGILIYAMLGYLAFHHETKAYRTYYTSIEMLISLALGQVRGMEDLLDEAKPMLQFYFISFVLFAQFFMINVLISVILDSHEVFKYQSALQPSDHELVDEIFRQVKTTMKKALDRYTQLQA